MNGVTPGEFPNLWCDGEGIGFPGTVRAGGPGPISGGPLALFWPQRGPPRGSPGVGAHGLHVPENMGGGDGCGGHPSIASVGTLAAVPTVGDPSHIYFIPPPERTGPLDIFGGYILHRATPRTTSGLITSAGLDLLTVLRTISRTVGNFSMGRFSPLRE